MKISLADRLGNVKKVRVGFSFFHFFTGPIYCFLHLKIFTGIFELLYIFYFLPLPGMNYLTDFISSLSFLPSVIITYVNKFLMFFRFTGQDFYFIFGILIFILLHLFFSFRVRNTSCKRYMKKKQLLPLDELDARILIKFHIAKENVILAEAFDIRQSNTYKSAEENWYENNQNRIKKSPTFENRSTLSLTPEDRYKARIEQVENSYKLGLITKSEYEKKLKILKEKK